MAFPEQEPGVEQKEHRTDELQNLGFFQAPQRIDGESIKWQLDPTDVLDEIKHYYRCEIKDNEGNWTPVFKGVVPMMNDEGINVLIGSLRQYLNKNVVLSNLSEDNIREIMITLVVDVLGDFIVMGYKRYGIEYANFNAIVHNTEHQIYCFLKRAENNGERLRWMKTQQISEVHQTVEEKQKKRLGLF